MEDRYPIIELIALLDDIFGTYEKQFSDKLESIRLTKEDVQEFENLLKQASDTMNEIHSMLYEHDVKISAYSDILDRLSEVIKRKEVEDGKE